MHACGLSGQLSCWSQSYVSSRQQFVELNGILSPSPEVRYGVPLGSREAPGLFSSCVNNFSDYISQGEAHLYADDTTAFVVGIIT